MISHDYSVYQRDRYTIAEVPQLSYDVFLSAFNDSDRVEAVYRSLSALRKIWLVHGEYGYAAPKLPTEPFWETDASEGAIDAWERCFRELGLDPSLNIAIDITGMMRPHLVTLPLMLRRSGFTSVTFIYSDPQSYVSGQSTQFTKGPVESVGVLPGFAGLHATSHGAKDCLIIGAGYDHDLVRAVAEHKRNAEHYLIVGLPALQPHMYQESVYRVARVKESLSGFRDRNLLFAPANNPFMTAQVLSDQVNRLRSGHSSYNFYLAPVGPKTQVLGFSLYYLCEGAGTTTSIVFPRASRYNSETSRGIETVHLFHLELDSFSSAAPLLP